LIAIFPIVTARIRKNHTAWIEKGLSSIGKIKSAFFQALGAFRLIPFKAD